MGQPIRNFHCLLGAPNNRFDDFLLDFFKIERNPRFKMDLGPKLLMSTDNSPLFQSTSSPNPSESHRSTEEIESNYEIADCAAWILERNVQNVALQFPDSMLGDAVRISDLLEKRIGFKPFILADTSYGSCCVDEVAAQHANAQCILHFGDACMSASEGRIPTRFVFPRSTFDENAFRDQLSKCHFESDTVGTINLVIDVCAGRAAEAITRIVQSSISKPCHVINLVNRQDQTTFTADVADSVFFIGETKNNPRLTLLMMENPGRKFISYDVASRNMRMENVDVNRMLKRRLYLVEKAKDAQIVGIVVGALSVGGYLQMVDRIKSLCRKAGKKFIVLSVGKINVAKLSNFADAVDVFVWISCPFNIMLETSEYPHPILTPFEMEVACDPNKQWYADFGWITDLRVLLEKAQNDQPAPATGDSSQETDISLITGRLRRIGVQEDTTSNNSLISRSDAMQLQPVSIESRFGEKSWKGLEERLGETPVTKVREGRRGIASGYEDETESKSGD